MSEQDKLEALRSVLASAKEGWASRERSMSFPPQFGVVQRMIDDQQRYLDDPVSLAVHCMGLFAECLPFEMLAVLVLSDEHLSDDNIAALDSDLEHGCPAGVLLEGAHDIDSARFQSFATHLDTNRDQRRAPHQ